jgi:hypothetical protein
MNGKENVVYTHRGILFSHKKAPLLHVPTWMNPEHIVLSEKSQSQKHKYSTHMKYKNRQIHGDRIVVTRSWVRGGTGMKFGFCKMKRILEVMVT